MELDRSSFYYKSKIEMEQVEAEADLRDRIESICLEFPRYGYRRVTHQLQHGGHGLQIPVILSPGIPISLKRWSSANSTRYGLPISPTSVSGVVLSIWQRYWMLIREG
jgi:putative transposase